MPQKSYSICGNCVYYFPLSFGDKKLLKSACTQSFIEVSDVKGLCIRGQESNGVFIDRILFEQYPLKHCKYKKMGERIFQTPYSCPDCSSHLFVKNDNGYKIFYCKRCKKIFKSLLINTNCRSCNKPLSLEAGIVFRCECHKCGKGIDIPILPQVYPSIIPKNELCTHGKKIEDCGLCLISFTNRSSILFHEVSTTIKKQREKSKENKLNYENYLRNRKTGPRIFTDGEENFSDEDDQEIISKYSPSNHRILDWSDDYDDIEDWADQTDVDDYNYGY